MRNFGRNERLPKVAARRCPKILKPFKPPFKTEIGRRVHEALDDSLTKPNLDSHGDGRSDR